MHIAVKRVGTYDKTLACMVPFAADWEATVQVNTFAQLEGQRSQMIFIAERQTQFDSSIRTA